MMATEILTNCKETSEETENVASLLEAKRLHDVADVTSRVLAVLGVSLL